MMGPRQVEQGVLFYNFSLDAHVPGDHLLVAIGRFVDLSELRRELAPFFGAATDVVPKFVSPADPARDGPEPMAGKPSPSIPPTI